MHMVSYERATLVSLALYIKLFEAFVQATVIWSFTLIKFLLESSLKIIYLGFLLLQLVL